MKKLLILGFAVCCTWAVQARKTYTLASPDGRLRTTVAVGDSLTYDIVRDGRTLMEASPIALTLTDGRVWGPSARVQHVARTSVDEVIASPLYRSSEVRDRYNGLTLKMRGDWSVELRASDDGIAYRFATTAREPFRVADEGAEYRFPEDYSVLVPYVAVGEDGNFESQWRNSFENTYSETSLSGLNSGRLAFLHLAVDLG